MTRKAMIRKVAVILNFYILLNENVIALPNNIFVVDLPCTLTFYVYSNTILGIT